MSKSDSNWHIRYYLFRHIINTDTIEWLVDFRSITFGEKNDYVLIRDIGVVERIVEQMPIDSWTYVVGTVKVMVQEQVPLIVLRH